MNFKLLAVLFICTIFACPTTAISRWFSATYNDLKFTMYRYAHCYSGLQPLSATNQTETDYLIQKIRLFLDQANFDHEQLTNVTALMGDICHDKDDYAVSKYIDVSKFENATGKTNRCQAIDDAMDAMYFVAKRAALNHSYPLDFSMIQFYPDETNHSISYNLTDLINVSWIKSETTIEQVCFITQATKEYVSMRTSNATAQARVESPAGPISLLVEYLNRLLDPILGLQKRLYWEGANRFGQFQSRLSSLTIGSIRNGYGKLVRTNATNNVAVNSSSPINSTVRTSPAPRDSLTSTSLNFTTSSLSTATVSNTTPAPQKSTTLALAPSTTTSAV